MLSSWPHPEQVSVLLDGIQAMREINNPLAKLSWEEAEVSNHSLKSAQSQSQSQSLQRQGSRFDATSQTLQMGFDPKQLYLHVKHLLRRLDEQGEDLFLHPEVRVCIDDR